MNPAFMTTSILKDRLTMGENDLATNCWIPLECNPQVMNELIRAFGVPEKWQLVDVLGLDDDLLAFVPQPVAAVILLFPVTDKYEAFRLAEENKARESQQVADKDLIFMKQLNRNACGTVALIHAIVNNTDKIELADGPLKDFAEKAKEMKNPYKIGELLAQSADIARTHESIALGGQSEAADPNISSENHFVAFVHKNGFLYELDGRKNMPIKWQKSSDDTLLTDAAVAVRKYMDSDPESIRFSVTALTISD